MIYHKNKIFKLLKGIIILLINCIINYYKYLNKKTFINNFIDCFSDLIKIFKFSLKISIFYSAVWYICCILLFKNKKLFLPFLNLNNPILIRRFIIIEIL